MSPRFYSGLIVICIAFVGVGCRSVPESSGSLTTDPLEQLIAPLSPSNHRDWDPNLAVLPYANIAGDSIDLHNIRNTTYITENDYIVHHYDKQFRLSDVQTVDFMFVPFNGAPALAHTFLSFGLADGSYISVSAEVRLEKGETYSPVQGALRQYEFMYVVADERDVILLRTQHRKADVYLYPTRATPQQTQELFRNVLRQANKLVVAPEFYDSLTNNCTTAIMKHVNEVTPGRIAYDYRVLFPGYSGELAYELGLLKTDVSFAQTKARAKITNLANLHQNDEGFSQLIRGKPVKKR